MRSHRRRLWLPGPPPDSATAQPWALHKALYALQCIKGLWALHLTGVTRSDGLGWCQLSLLAGPMAQGMSGSCVI